MCLSVVSSEYRPDCCWLEWGMRALTGERRGVGGRFFAFCGEWSDHGHADVRLHSIWRGSFSLLFSVQCPPLPNLFSAWNCELVRFYFLCHLYGSDTLWSASPASSVRLKPQCSDSVWLWITSSINTHSSVLFGSMPGKSLYYGLYTANHGYCSGLTKSNKCVYVFHNSKRKTFQTQPIFPLQPRLINVSHCPTDTLD